MALRLTYCGETSVPVEMEGFTPDWAAGKSLAAIERFEIFHGNQKLPLAEMFTVTGDAAEGRFDFEGDLSGVHWIGAHMQSGSIHIHGPVGRHLGSQMRGGEIVVHGNAGGWLGCEMRKGTIWVHGDAGNLVGAAYRGSAKGMTGGTILIDGHAGDEVGHTMRRGLVVVGGNAGDMPGFNMIAGTVLVFGACGIRLGAGMRRGTIGVFGANPPPLLPSFRYGSTFQPTILRLLLRHLREHGFPVDDDLLHSAYDLHHGDLVSVGRGEIFIRNTAV